MEAWEFKPGSGFRYSLKDSQVFEGFRDFKSMGPRLRGLFPDFGQTLAVRMHVAKLTGGVRCKSHSLSSEVQ